MKEDILIVEVKNISFIHGFHIEVFLDEVREKTKDYNIEYINHEIKEVLSKTVTNKITQTLEITTSYSLFLTLKKSPKLKNTLN